MASIPHSVEVRTTTSMRTDQVWAAAMETLHTATNPQLGAVNTIACTAVAQPSTVVGITLPQKSGRRSTAASTTLPTDTTATLWAVGATESTITIPLLLVVSPTTSTPITRRSMVVTTTTRTRTHRPLPVACTIQHMVHGRTSAVATLTGFTVPGAPLAEGTETGTTARRLPLVVDTETGNMGSGTPPSVEAMPTTFTLTLRRLAAVNTTQITALGAVWVVASTTSGMDRTAQLLVASRTTLRAPATSSRAVCPTRCTAHIVRFRVVAQMLWVRHMRLLVVARATTSTGTPPLSLAASTPRPMVHTLPLPGVCMPKLCPRRHSSEVVMQRGPLDSGPSLLEADPTMLMRTTAASSAATTTKSLTSSVVLVEASQTWCTTRGPSLVAVLQTTTTVTPA
mmetsp:Transcript_45207/g.66574  ORF Transcript_45207/g.66574 Transcript_45207/m.66574 type:complete len:397 (+) Transcript_45207:1602-2792(+)